MLGADLLALAAFDTFRSTAVARAGDDIIIIVCRVPVVERLMLVLSREQVGDTYALGAGVLLYAVAAGGSGDEVQATEDAAHTADGLPLALV